MNEKPKSKRHWRLLRWLLIGTAVLVTFVALLVTEEDWRGKHAWENYQRDAAARGEQLDIASVIPPSVPDDQNFFCAPIVAESMNSKQSGGDYTSLPRGSNDVNRISFGVLYRGDFANQPGHKANWLKGELTDFVPLQTYMQNFNDSPADKTNRLPVATHSQSPAADTLLKLSALNPAIEELRQASLRPYARIPLHYENGFDAVGELLPWLSNLKRCSQLILLRSGAELQDGQGQSALEDVKLALRLNDSIREQPFLISHLVRMAMMSITLQPVYEGVVKHQWSDDQLRELEQVLAKEDFLADFGFAMQGEKICAIESFEKQRSTRVQISATDNPHTFVTNTFRFVPAAFFYQNELNFARMHQDHIVPLVDLTNRTVAPAALAMSQAAMQSQMKHYSYYKIESQIVFPAIAASVSKFAAIQAQIDLAQTACALERYRLAHGEYPAALDTLAPQFIEKLPHDIINGQPLHYRRTNDGKFVLYSVGWNETDDGGQVVLTKNGSIDNKKGDWVWKN